MPKEPKKPSKTAPPPKRLRAVISAPFLGARANRALFITQFATNTRAVLKSTWPQQVQPGVEVDTYEIDASHKHIGSIPFREDVLALTRTGQECLAKQGQEQGAATQAWLIVEVNG